MKKKLYRSVNDKKLCGVCAGVGEYFDIDPTLIRIVYALLTAFLAGFPGVILYIILAFIIPENPVSNMDDKFDDK
ncbi:MAG: PspC domain-containing protein [Clostridia bacterium]|nr:PspC domain-containing protein [Clostridia bacterium]